MVEPLSAGDWIKDNDPRMPQRLLKVVRVTQERAICDDLVGRPFPILLRRIYLDGRPRRSGFTRVNR